MVGSHVAEHFARRGDTVVVLDNLIRSTLFGASHPSVEFNWKYLGGVDSIRLIKGDVRNRADVEAAVGDGVDAVVHAAGQPGVGYSIQHPEEDFTINAQGTVTVLEVLRQRSPKAAVVYCSTNKVYGEHVGNVPLKEEPTRYAFDGLRAVPVEMPTDLTPHTPYGVSKLAGELYVQEYAHTYGLRTGVFRMSCIYGTRQFGFEDQGWVAHFMIAAVLGRPLTIYGDGKQVRDVLYVADLVAAFERFITGSVRHGVYNIGGGPMRTLSLRELVQWLERRFHRRLSIRYADWRPSDQRVYISDLTKVGRDLGWAPQVEVPEGLERLAAWVEEHQGLWPSG
jgi:CDP-paratose 2-epimerase